jgi:hypothetical protein
VGQASCTGREASWARWAAKERWRVGLAGVGEGEKGWARQASWTKLVQEFRKGFQFLLNILAGILNEF